MLGAAFRRLFLLVDVGRATIEVALGAFDVAFLLTERIFTLGQFGAAAAEFFVEAGLELLRVFAAFHFGSAANGRDLCLGGLPDARGFGFGVGEAGMVKRGSGELALLFVAAEEDTGAGADDHGDRRDDDG